MNTRLLTFALLTLPVWAQQSEDRTLQDKLATASSTYSVTAPDWLHALTKVAGAFHLPMGIEWIKTADNPGRFTRSWSDTTPLAILQDLVKAQPGYELEVSGDVVHVLPTAMKGDPADMLNKRIGPFAVDNQWVSTAAHGSLFSRVYDIIVPPKPNSAGHAFSILSGAGDGVVTFRQENPTVREVLDKLCLGAGLKIWIIAYPPTPVKTPTGFLTTIRLFDGSLSIANWEFLPWGSNF